MANVLVTGGSGFIGSHLVRALVADGHAVVNLDIKPPIEPEPQATWIKGDLLSKPALEQAVAQSQPEIVIHAAARAEIQSRTLEAFDSIHVGTRNLLDVLDRAPTLRRLINTSTQLVVGPGQTATSDTDFKPYTPYGEAKAIAERELRERNPSYTWVTVRPTNIWGPRHPHFAQSIWRYIRKRYYLHPETREPVVRCYGYVSNTIDQFLALMHAPAERIDRRVFYLADGAIDSTLWLDAFSRELSGKPVRRLPWWLLKLLAAGGDVADALRLPAPLSSERLMRMSTSYPVPLEPIMQLAGKPKLSLDMGVKETAAWLRRQFPEIYGRAP